MESISDEGFWRDVGNTRQLLIQIFTINGLIRCGEIKKTDTDVCWCHYNTKFTCYEDKL
jgi:hypothetical protein